MGGTGTESGLVLNYVYGESAAVYRSRERLSTPWPRDRRDPLASMTEQPDPVPDKTIVLIGLMGAGKSAIGRRLASRLERPFVDSDSEIEAAAGCSIEDIFELHGEAVFRDLERRVMKRLLSDEPTVLAAGGGAFLDLETRTLIRESTVSVWLHADLEVLLARVSRRKNRPLLEGKDKRAVLKRLMAERDPIYSQADIVVESSDDPHEAVVSKIIVALSHYRREHTESGGEARTPTESLP